MRRSLLALVLCATACGGDPSPDAGADAGRSDVTPPMDAGAGRDAGADAGAGTDAGGADAGGLDCPAPFTPEAKPPATAVICDINFEMLKAGAARADMASFGERLARVTGDAENLPFPSGAADAYTIAFGIRNVTDIDAALSEAFRVLKPGGRFYCLEFSHPVTEGLQKIYDAYSFNVIPWLGEKVADDRESYRYLVESIRRFPGQEAFAARIAKAGFTRIKYENLTGGVADIHSGWKI